MGARSGGNSLILDFVSLTFGLAFFLFSFKEGDLFSGLETDLLFSEELLSLDDLISVSLFISLEEATLIVSLV